MTDDASIDTKALRIKFDRMRSGVDPSRLVATELQNVTDVLLEILKELRKKAP